MKYPFILLFALSLVWGEKPVTKARSMLVETVPTYSITELEHPENSLRYTPLHINSSGDVVGISTPGNSSLGRRPVLWRNSKIHMLTASLGEPKSINENGQIVFMSNVVNANDLLKIDPLEKTIDASNINNKGDVAGATKDGNGNDQACLWSEGKLTQLGSLGGKSSFAYDVNDNKQIVGWAKISPSQAIHAFLWSKGRMQDLGTLPECRESNALRINNAGQVIGMSEGGKEGGLFWQNGRMVRIPLLSGFTSNYPHDINNAGLVVGQCSKIRRSGVVPSRTDIQGNLISRAFLYISGKIYDINNLIAAKSEWVVQSANGINDKGQIVGTGLFRGKERPILLTPMHNL